jgi:hypothetical protein
MGLASTVQGNTKFPQVITWTDGDGDAVDLTGATVTGMKRPTNSTASTAIAGTLTVTDATAGKFTWTPAAADVATAGTFSVQFTATYAGPLLERTLIETWVVEPAIT